MTASEQLDLAAKAAGFPKEWRGSIKIQTDHGPRWWVPRDDDGDALRLAVKLNLDIMFDVDQGGAFVSVGSWFGDEDEGSWCKEYLHKDAAAATRLAIVRAAAEIGKTMP